VSFWWLALKDLLFVGRDKKALLTLIMMPLLLIAILGAAFGDMMKAESDVTIKKFKVGVVNLDKGPLGNVLTNEVFGKSLSEQIQVKKYNKKQLIAKIKDHKLSVGIIIGSDFSTSLMAEEQVEIKLLTVPDPGVKAMIVQSVINQFSESFAIEAAATKRLNAQPVQAEVHNEGNQPVPSGSTQVTGEEQKVQHLLIEKTINSETEPVSSFQYYAAAMGVMFLLMTVVQGVSTMIEEKEQAVYKRLLVSSLTFKNYLAGKMLGLIILGVIQAFIIIVGTKLLFGVNWGESVSGIMLMTVAFVFNTCGLGVLAGSFIKKQKTFDAVGMLASQIFAALGGSMAPLYIFPDWVVMVTKGLPNGLALQTYLELMSGANLFEILPAIFASIGLGLLFFAIGLFRLSSERRGRYA
jgi:ABC-2 type transport system permease protein